MMCHGTNITLWLVLVGLFMLNSTNADDEPESSGTTHALMNIFLGRCYEYKELESLNLLKEYRTSVDCNQAWNLFKKSFAFKDMCAMKEEDYDDFFELLNDTEKANNILFWSGTRGFAHDLSHVNHDYVTLEDTFPGYIANDLKWCGCKNCPSGIDFNSCNKSCSFDRAYWGKASKNLVGKAQDTAYLILNGTARGYRTAYYRGNMFGSLELPLIGKLQQVKKLIVLVVFDVDKDPKERCGEGSLKELVADAKKYGIEEVECRDDSVAVFSVLCAKYPHADQCKRMHSHN